MSTRSTIAIKKKDGTIRAIYCHSDGYPEYTGAILLEYYSGYRKALKLINLESLIYVAEHVEPIFETFFCSKSWVEGNNHRHSYETPHPEVTVASHRDRGETLSIDNYSSEADWLKADYGDDYRYIFKDNQWYVGTGSSKRFSGLQLLTSDLAKDGFTEDDE